MTLIPFRPEHVEMMDVQPAQRLYIQQAEDLQCGDAWTGMADDGTVVGCAGLVEIWEGRAYAWAVLSAGAGRHMRAIVKAAKAKLDASPIRRIEIAVDCRFGPGCHLARLLGFQLEAKCRAYLFKGRDAFLYARVKHG
jgi:hypothetical protein